MKKLLTFLAVVTLCLALGGIARANLVVNGGFETGDFTGWTLSGNTGDTFVSGSPYNFSGSYGAQLGPVGSDGYLSQTLPTTAGTIYFVSFWLENEGGPLNSFTTYWGGTDVGPDLVNSNAFPWTYFSGYVSAPTNSTVLEFAYFQNSSYWGLDDVNVSSTIPLPGAVWLLGSGLVGLLGLRRFRKG